MAKKILFIHNNFPGQFPRIAQAARAAGYELAAIASQSAKDFDGVRVLRWSIKRGTTAGIFDPATRAEADLLRADAAAEQARNLKASGFIPNLIIGHPGWGETIHMSIIFPGVPQIMFGEFYYLAKGGDVGFDREFETPNDAQDMRVHAKNATQALAYAQADVIVSPTRFQGSTFPVGLRSTMRVFHEGVSLNAATKNPKARLKLPDGTMLDGTKPVITFINRNFERLRGFHIFMRALPAFMAARPDAQVIIIGRDSGGGYGGQLGDNMTWKQKMLAEVGDKIDQSRLHFTGPVSHANMIAAMSLSWAHVYYTYPFVLSWSLVEAMACECLILGSDTAPVRDAITSGQNGVLNDFFDVDALSRSMIDACENPRAYDAMRTQARATALALFDTETVGIPAWMALIDEMMNKPRHI
jgi:glycosyltransferase involved in cell wall biosynthesis